MHGSNFTMMKTYNSLGVWAKECYDRCVSLCFKHDLFLLLSAYQCCSQMVWSLCKLFVYISRDMGPCWVDVSSVLRLVE